MNHHSRDMTEYNNGYRQAMSDIADILNAAHRDGAVVAIELVANWVSANGGTLTVDFSAPVRAPQPRSQVDVPGMCSSTWDEQTRCAGAEGHHGWHASAPYTDSNGYLHGGQVWTPTDPATGYRMAL